MPDLTNELRLFTTHIGTESVVEIGGELDLATVRQLSAHLDAVIAAGTSSLLIDATLVTFCDSTVLSVLVVTAGHMEAAGGRIRIVNPSSCVTRLVELTGLEHLLAE